MRQKLVIEDGLDSISEEPAKLSHIASTRRIKRTREDSSANYSSVDRLKNGKPMARAERTSAAKEKSLRQCKPDQLKDDRNVKFTKTSNGDVDVKYETRSNNQLFANSIKSERGCHSIPRQEVYTTKISRYTAEKGCKTITKLEEDNITNDEMVKDSSKSSTSSDCSSSDDSEPNFGTREMPIRFSRGTRYYTLLDIVKAGGTIATNFADSRFYCNKMWEESESDHDWDPKIIYGENANKLLKCKESEPESNSEDSEEDEEDEEDDTEEEEDNED